MKKYGRDNRPHVKPVTRIELSESNIKLRWIAIAVLLTIAVVSIASGLKSALNTESGWQVVEASSNQVNCSGDFTLMYDFTDAGSAATSQFRQLTTLYTGAAENAYRIFSAEVLEENLGNVAYLNAHANETVTVDESLYEALQLVVEYGDRHVFLAPATVEYNRVFLCEEDGEAAAYDPTRNEETKQFLLELAQFVNDPEQISLELLGSNRARLNVSDAYLHFAEEYGIETFLDFGWMTNAFRADYLAEALTENGYTSGYLASYDGFTRNLDMRGEAYTFNIFDRNGTDIHMPAVMYYAQPASIVFLRDYPMVERDRWHYYGFETGEIITAFLDPADGLCKSALSDLVSYSTETGCAEILLQIAPVFIAEDFRADTLSALTDSGVYSIWSEGNTIKYNDDGLDLELLTEEAGSVYNLSLEK